MTRLYSIFVNICFCLLLNFACFVSVFAQSFVDPMKNLQAPKPASVQQMFSTAQGIRAIQDKASLITSEFESDNKTSQSIVLSRNPNIPESQNNKQTVNYDVENVFPDKSFNDFLNYNILHKEHKALLIEEAYNGFQQKIDVKKFAKYELKDDVEEDFDADDSHLDSSDLDKPISSKKANSNKIFVKPTVILGSIVYSNQDRWSINVNGKILDPSNLKLNEINVVSVTPARAQISMKLVNGTSLYERFYAAISAGKTPSKNVIVNTKSGSLMLNILAGQCFFIDELIILNKCDNLYINSGYLEEEDDEEGQEEEDDGDFKSDSFADGVSSLKNKIKQKR